MGIKVILVAAVALFDEDGRVLMARRPVGKEFAGYWEFPGGKIEAGETPEQALIRELREELQIDSEAACMAPVAFASHPYEDFHLLMPLFACRKWKGQPVAAEGQELKWIRTHQIHELKLVPADVPLASQLRDMF